MGSERIRGACMERDVAAFIKVRDMRSCSTWGLTLCAILILHIVTMYTFHCIAIAAIHTA